VSLPTFRGGIHPPGCKSLTENKEVERLCPAGDFVFPMSQHIGVPCSPVVQKGDRVLVGQKLGDADAFVSAPILSSVSGKVKDVGARMTVTGAVEPCVVVESDGEFERGEFLERGRDFRELDPKEILRTIREAGIVGMGGATFPTHVKLSPPPDKKIKWVIVNGAECEPFLNCDNRLMLEHPGQVIGGLRICMRLFPEARGIVAIENNKPEGIRRMESELSGHGGDIAVMSHEVKYPQGAEKMLIYSVTGQEIPPGALPAEVGCIIVNVRTLYHIWAAVTDGEPVADRIVSVTGDVVKDPKNILVPLGASVRDLVDACGGFTEEPAKVISGGPMMGISMRSIDVPVVKGTSGILALSQKSAYYPAESNCIRCGRCITGCPMGLEPSGMDRLVRLRDYERFDAVGGMNCIECGSCAYNCPSRRYLVQSFRDGKAGVNEMRRKQKEKGEKK
jgi:electron transport complex protein RnfC